MKIIDISEELLGCEVYPGDPRPSVNKINDMARGDIYNLSTLSLCAHNGTHVDAPAHFILGGKSIDELELEYFVGDCYLARLCGTVTREDAREVMRRAKDAGAHERILLAGELTVTSEAAEVFRDEGVRLLGNESRSVGPIDAPMAVHLILLEREILPLEGLRLTGIAEGRYFLSAAPINIRGIDGAPCRAYLIEY